MILLSSGYLTSMWQAIEIRHIGRGYEATADWERVWRVVGRSLMGEDEEGRKVGECVRARATAECCAQCTREHMRRCSLLARVCAPRCPHELPKMCEQVCVSCSEGDGVLFRYFIEQIVCIYV